MRCVKSTIINRAYYSSYSLASEWLDFYFDFQIKPPGKFKNNRPFVSGHIQVLKALFKYEKKDANFYLGRLKDLRTKADYHLESKISDNEVNDALVYMKRIFNDLKFGD